MWKIIGLKSVGRKPNTYSQQRDTDPARMKRYMETEMVKFQTVQSVKYLGSTIDRRGGASKYVESIVAIKGMVEMETTEWSDLQQEMSNKIEAPDRPDSDSTNVALWLRNVVNVS